MILLDKTTSILQIAFGINFIFGYLLINFISLKEELINTFIQEITSHFPNFNLTDKKPVVNVLLSLNKVYRVMNLLFVFSFIIAFLNTVTAFILLYKAAVSPELASIKQSYFLVICIWMLFISPTIYWLTKAILEKLIERSKKEQLSYPEANQVIETLKLTENISDSTRLIDKLYVEYKISCMKSRIRHSIRTIQKVMHPIKYYQDKKLQQEIEDIISNSKNIS